VEQYRRLAASLHHAQADRGIRTVMICSALGGEGKSLTATNLALTLSESYRRRVLLVDADLRRPSLTRVFGLPEASGLSDGLLSEDDRRLAVTQLSAYLTLLPAGRPTSDPMSSLTSNRMKHIVSEAREAFDWVIIDTPPIALLSDASLLGAMVDAAVLVVRAGHTPLDAVKKALDTLHRRRVMGIVLNRTEPGGPSHDYLGYYGSHYRTD
jgi:capsular exopolysaccharide synthesis family protein